MPSSTIDQLLKSPYGIVTQWKEVEIAIKLRYGSGVNVEAYGYDIRTCSFIRVDLEKDRYSFVHECVSVF